MQRTFLAVLKLLVHSLKVAAKEYKPKSGPERAKGLPSREIAVRA